MIFSSDPGIDIIVVTSAILLLLFGILFYCITGESETANADQSYVDAVVLNVPPEPPKLDETEEVAATDGVEEAKVEDVVLQEVTRPDSNPSLKKENLDVLEQKEESKSIHSSPASELDVKNSDKLPTTLPSKKLSSDKLSKAPGSRKGSAKSSGKRGSTPQATNSKQKKSKSSK